MVQALGQLRFASESAHGGQGSMPAGARALLTLQSSQLGGAAELFAASMEGMERDLESIAVRVQEMANASRSLMGISTEDENSFFLQMEGQFTAILKMLGSCAAAQGEVESTAASLEETISSMQDSVGEIRSIEIRIQRIATNATIRATHIGKAGNALNVIAEVMQRLDLDSNANTEDVAEKLAEMRNAAHSVSGRCRRRFGPERGDQRDAARGTGFAYVERVQLQPGEPDLGAGRTARGRDRRSAQRFLSRFAVRPGRRSGARRTRAAQRAGRW